MSAWIVSQAHIDVLVQALCEGEIVTDVDPDEVGLTLWQENHKSVNIRYGEDERTPDYTYRRPAIKPEPAGVQKAVHCYQYQCAEWDGWDQTQAQVWVNALRDNLDATIGKDAWNSDRYPWGYEERHVHGEAA